MSLVELASQTASDRCEQPDHTAAIRGARLALPGQKRKLRPNIRDLRPEDEISYHIEIAAKLGLFCPGSARTERVFHIPGHVRPGPDHLRPGRPLPLNTRGWIRIGSA